MNFYRRAIQRDRLDPDANDLRTLQFREHAIQYAALGPSVHPRVDRVPPTEAFWQTAPLATVLSNIKNRIQNVQVRHTYVATLTRQAVFNLSILGFGDLHHRRIQLNPISVNTP